MDLLAALLDACRERPDDDLPRRVLGDWLLDEPDEASQARGEFVHLQLDLAAGKKGGQARHDELLAAFGAEWLGPLAGVNAKFERGLIELKFDAWSDTPEGSFGVLTRREPPPAWRWVTRLVLRGASRSQLQSLASWPGLAVVASLTFQDMHSTDGVAWLPELGSSPYFQINELHLHAIPPDRAGLDGLGSLRLSVLCLRHCNLTDADTLALRDTPLMPYLRRLALPDNHLHAEAAEALATCPGLAGLKSLNLGRNVIGAGGARKLGHAMHLEALEELDLRLNGIRDEGALDLYRSPLGQRLRKLNLVSNGVLSPEVQRLWRERLGDGVEF